MSNIKMNFTVGFVHESRNIDGVKTSEMVTLHAAAPKEYVEGSVDPNNSYALGSPTGEVALSITNPEVWGFFKVGDSFAFELSKM